MFILLLNNNVKIIIYNFNNNIKNIYYMQHVVSISIYSTH